MPLVCRKNSVKNKNMPFKSNVFAKVLNNRSKIFKHVSTKPKAMRSKVANESSLNSNNAYVERRKKGLSSKLRFRFTNWKVKVNWNNIVIKRHWKNYERTIDDWKNWPSKPKKIARINCVCKTCPRNYKTKSKSTNDKSKKPVSDKSFHRLWIVFFLSSRGNCCTQLG